MTSPQSSERGEIQANDLLPREDKRSRDYILYILAGLAVAVFSGSLLIGLQRLSDSRTALYANRATGSWIAYNLELEYRRFIDTLNRYGLGDERTTHTELMQRFDILWSRVPVLVEGPDVERLKDTPEAQALARDLMAALYEVDPVVSSMEHGDRANYRQVLSILGPFSQQVRDLLVMVEIDLKQTFRQQVIDSAYNYVFVSFIGVLLGGGAMMALLIVQMRRTAKLSEAHRLARSAAVSANAAKTEFLARMTHELRTPLTAVIGYSELLKEEVAERGYLDIEEDLERIRFAGNHLLSMINDTLDLAKIETGRTELYLTQVDALELTAELVDSVQPLVRRNRNRLDVDCKEVGNVITDATKLRQILLNLLSNAAKFTTDGQILLELRLEPGSHGGWLRYRIHDTGPGISKEMQERIFEPFVQVDGSSTRVHGGTGLGLSIARSFCELMGGSVAIESDPGNGTTFTVRIPVDVSAATPHALENSRYLENPRYIAEPS